MAGILVASDGGDDLWPGISCVAFFGLGCVIFTIQMMPGGSFLQLDRTGFTIHAMFQERSYEWAEIDSFFVGKYPTIVKMISWIGFSKWVSWNFVPSHPKAKGSMYRTINRGDARLPDTYGKKHEELAALMNAWLSASRDARSASGSRF